MQDRGIDEQFTNQAWEQMKHLLDEEMPVSKKRRRRGLLWLLFFLIGLSIGGGMVGFWSYYQKEEQPIAENSTIPIATQQPESVEIIEENKTSEQSLIHSNEIAAKKQEGITELKAHTEEPNFETNQITSSHSNNIQSERKNENTVRELETANQNFNLALEPISSNLEKRWRLLENINTLEIFINYTSQPNYIFEPFKEEEEKIKANKFSYGAEAGLLSTGTDFLSGGTFNLIGQLRLNNRWAISAGLGYSLSTIQLRYSANSLLADELSLADGGSTPVTSGGNNGSPTTEGSNTDGPDTQVESQSEASLPSVLDLDLGYSQMPVWGSFYLKKWFRLDFGAQLSYISSISRSSVNEEDLLSSPGSFSSSADKRILNASGQVNTMEIRRFGVGLIGGFSFWPNEQIGINLHYHHGLSKISKIANYRTTNQYVKLSAIYLF